MNKNRLADDLRDLFTEYQLRLDKPMPEPNQTTTQIRMYLNDRFFRAKVDNLVAGVMHVVIKNIEGIE